VASDSLNALMARQVVAYRASPALCTAILNAARIKCRKFATKPLRVGWWTDALVGPMIAATQRMGNQSAGRR